MDALKVIGGIVTAFFLIVVIGSLGVIGGIISGWIVGLFFSDLIIGFISRFGVNTIGLEVWQVGGALGFIGAFFKSVSTGTSHST